MKRVFSLGSGTKVWGPSSMTQLLLLESAHAAGGVWWYTDFMDMLASRWRF